VGWQIRGAYTASGGAPLKFGSTPLPGVFTIEPELRCDERGFFGRTFCIREFEYHELNPRMVQCSISFNRRSGTLRGMHYQISPQEETKLVRCTRGAIYDVALDLRPDSPSFLRWCSVELTAENHTMLYVPAGVAHGFQTLTDETEVFYQISEFYEPSSARGVRWNDPSFAIHWPIEDRIVSTRDAEFPLFDDNRQSP
jgi:dTDP-4-dehydrorhamnose 3,5-epimerase